MISLTNDILKGLCYFIRVNNSLYNFEHTKDLRSICNERGLFLRSNMNVCEIFTWRYPRRNIDRYP
jgi:hypothetical protein